MGTKPAEPVVTPVPYDCNDCDMVVAMYPGFIMTHLGRDRHGFTPSGSDNG